MIGQAKVNVSPLGDESYRQANQQAAETAAIEDAHATAAAALAFVKCPGCGHRARKRPSTLRSGWFYGLSAALLASVAAAWRGLSTDAVALGAAGFLAGAATLATSFVRSMRPSRAELGFEAASTAKFRKASRSKQLSGTMCAECAAKIVMQSEGAPCPKCSAPLHAEACLSRHVATAHATSAAGPYRR